MFRRCVVGSLSLTLCLSACGGDASSEASGSAGSEGESTSAGDTGDTGDAQRPNWHEDIAPLVAEHCVGCHQDGGIAPFAIPDYQTAKLWAPLIAENVAAGLMPPWHAVDTEECTHPHGFVGDARLDDETIALFVDWDGLGAPEGDPTNAADIPEAPNLHLDNPTATLPMSGSLSIEAQGNTLDFFHCLSFDPGLSEDVYMDAFEVIPGNPNIAHHVLVYLDEGAGSASWTDGLRENCGGGSGGVNAKLIGGWVPGTLPQVFPEGVGVRIPAGSRLIFNYHYHATGGGAEVDDSTAIALRYSTQSPDWVGEFSLVGNENGAIQNGQGNVDPPFLIPAGSTQHVEEMYYTVPDFPALADVRLFNVGSHAHVIGTDILTTVEPSNGDPSYCALQTPNWDFDWQRLYTYDVPIAEAPRIHPGDIVRVRCTYNNSLSNPDLGPALAEQGLSEPVDVYLGEGSLDEMCLAAVGFAIKQF